jgi:Tol biopolymer transport system component
VLGFRSVEDAQISPDGQQVAYVCGDSFKSDSKWAESSIWLVDTTWSPRQLTSGPRTDSLPLVARWAAVSLPLRPVADGQRQVFSLSMDGGRSHPR